MSFLYKIAPIKFIKPIKWTKKDEEIVEKAIKNKKITKKLIKKHEKILLISSDRKII